MGNMKFLAISLLLLPLLLGCESNQKQAMNSRPSGANKIHLTLHQRFESFGENGLPEGWRIGETNGEGKQARWGKVAGKKGAGFGVLETHNSGSTFNMALFDDWVVKDFVARLWVHAREGQEDQGGGLVWRAKDFDHYYICRWNPLENNFRFYKVVGGRRSMLASSQVKTDPKLWHLLRIEAHGPKVRIFFDGTLKMETEDRSFLEPGKFGLWTKADAATSFDELEIQK